MVGMTLAAYLRNNGPWDQLVRYENVKLYTAYERLWHWVQALAVLLLLPGLAACKSGSNGALVPRQRDWLEAGLLADVRTQETEDGVAIILNETGMSKQASASQPPWSRSLSRSMTTTSFPSARKSRTSRSPFLPRPQITT